MVVFDVDGYGVRRVWELLFFVVLLLLLRRSVDEEEMCWEFDFIDRRVEG